MELLYRQRACTAGGMIQLPIRCKAGTGAASCFLRFGEHRGLRVSYGESRKNTVHLQMCVIG